MSPLLSQSVYWYIRKPPHPGEQLAGSVNAQVAIIGGGMAGLSCAQRLADAGVSAVVLERDFCGAGASGKTSGFITPDSEIELSSLLRTYGPEKAKRIWEFVLSGVENIRANISRYRISCDDQVQDSLFIANSPAAFRKVVREHEARQRLGYASTLYEGEALRNVIGSPAYAGAVRYPDTFGINSYLYCQALRDALTAAGVRIYERSSARRIEGHEVVTAQGRVTAEHIVACTDRFIPETVGALRQAIYHVQTFLGITRPLTPAQVREIFPSGKLMMVWDTDLVYHYFRVTGDNRLLVGGGDLRYTYARHTARHIDGVGRKLAQYVRKKFPALNLEFEHLWPGMLGVSKDLLPIMGPDRGNHRVWYVGAATGLPWAAVLGRYAAERVLSGRNEFDEDFSPRRRFVIGSRLQSLLTTPATYALSHGIAKYF